MESDTSIVVHFAGIERDTIGLIEKFSDRVTALRCQ